MFKSRQQITQEIFDAIVTKVQVFLPTYNPDFDAKTVEKAIAEGNSPEIWNGNILTEKIRRQNNPLTANSESVTPQGTLEQWGFIKLGRKPFVKGKGEYSIQFSGVGGIYEAGSRFINTSTGFGYTLKDRVVVNEGGGQVDITLSDSSTLGSPEIRLTKGVEVAITSGVVISEIGGVTAALKPGDFISAVSILAGVDNPSQVIEVLVAPTESESLIEYKEDTLQAYRIPKKGGGRGDCILWGENVSGVRHIYPYAGDELGVLGAGWIVIESTIGQGVASDELIDLVKNEIDKHIAVPDCGIVFESVVSTELTVIVKDLTGIKSEDLNVVQSDIETVTSNYFKTIRPFIDGVDRTTARNDKLKRVDLVAIVQDAVSIYGGFISDAYWDVSEREKPVEQNQVFRVSSVRYI